jgi:hypothetical protein
VRLAGDGLFVHSPVSLAAETREAVAALGPVAAIVAPSRFHHLWAGDWSRAWPEAVLCACSGLERKRADLPWHRVLGDPPEPEWAAPLDQVWFGAREQVDRMLAWHFDRIVVAHGDAIETGRREVLRRAYAWL